MELKKSLDRHRQVLMLISSLPRKIVSLQGLDNITEFVLHELCSKDCFDLKQAAYLINNGCFNCLKGVAGYNHQGRFNVDPWKEPDNFSEHMRKHQFNQKVRSVENNSVNDDQLKRKAVDDLAGHLGMLNVGFHVFKLKHNNNGVFLYEKPENDELISYIPDALYLLSFCPIF